MADSILLVDDEVSILKAFQRAIKNPDWEIFVAEDGFAALAILAERNIDIIISDMLMPNMNGYKLLQQVKNLYPGTTRLILSGFSEEKDVIQAMLDGTCKLYIMKPWENHMLKETIQQILEVRKILRNRNLLNLINKIDGLCTQPSIFAKLTDMIDKGANMRQMAAVIEEDPIMTARVLQMVNSAFFGIRTGSVSQAIVYLGLPTVKTIVLTASLCEILPHHGGLFSKEQLWRQAIITNQIVGRMYHRLTGKQLPNTSASVGLLHHLGRMAMIHHMPDKYEQLAAILQKQPTLPFDQLEEEIIGVAHQDVGGYLLDWWHLPHQIVESILFHHCPANDAVGDKELAAVVHIASNYALKMVAPGIVEILDEQAFTILNTTREAWETLIKGEQLGSIVDHGHQ